MSLEKKDIEDVRLARPIAVVDVWDMDDRIEKLEALTERLESVVKTLVTLYHSERVKNWEMILREMLRHEEKKKAKRPLPVVRESYPEEEERNDEF